MRPVEIEFGDAWRKAARDASEFALRRYVSSERRRAFAWGFVAGGALVFVALVWAVNLR